ncbi:hypothetical protein GCM10010295_28900 [Streptomyces intermedius]
MVRPGRLQQGQRQVGPLRELGVDQAPDQGVSMAGLSVGKSAPGFGTGGGNRGRVPWQGITTTSVEAFSHDPGPPGNTLQVPP